MFSDFNGSKFIFNPFKFIFILKGDKFSNIIKGLIII